MAWEQGMPHWTIDLGRSEVRDAANQHLALRRRSFELLLYLARRHDQVVPKDELIAVNWHGLAVTDDSLTKCISDIRQALGPGLRDTVRTASGRGYMLTGWHRDDEGRLLSALDAAEPPVARRGNLPAAMRLIGRDEEIAALGQLLSKARLVTILGPGGVGKTWLSVAAAAASHGFLDGVWFVQLGPLRSEGTIPGAILAAMGVETAQKTPEGVAAVMEGQQMLLVLDNCEHLVSAASDLAGLLLAAVPGLTVLATSREALGVDEEQLFRLQTLGYPADAEGLSAVAAQEHPAIELLCTRARLADRNFRLTDPEVPAAVELCRRLDGIPLAIVLAAARLGTMGLCEITRSLDRRFELLSNGPRNADERQRTLRAMVGWSVYLLTVSEQQLFAELGVFAGPASADDIIAVCRVEGKAPAIEQILALADKSLLNVHADATGPTCYGYHETTRHYALERLAALGGREVHLRLVRHLIDVFRAGESQVEYVPPRKWRDTYLRYLDNVRAALGWSFSPDGDAGLAVELVARTPELFEEVSLQAERVGWIERTLALVPAGTDPGLLGRLKHWRAVGDSWGIADRYLAREAAEHFVQSGETIWEGRARSVALIGDASAGEPELVREGDEQAERLLAPAGNTRSMTDYLRYRALALQSLGGLEEAEASIMRSAAIAEVMGDDKGVLWARDFLINRAFERGEFERAAALQEELIGVAEAIGSGVDILYGYTYLATCRLFLGDAGAAVEPLRRAFEVRRKAGTRQAQGLHVGLIALYLALIGDDAAPLALFALGLDAKRNDEPLRFETAVLERLRAHCANLGPEERMRLEAQSAHWSLDHALSLAAAALA